MNTSGAKLSRWLLAILMLGAHSQQTAFAQSVPSVTQQPQSQNLLAGTDATFTVSATGQTPLSYQWSFNGSNLLNSPHISGATNATLIISNIAPADAGSYQGVVTNRHGSATSSNAMLTVLVPARITGQPSSQSVPLSSNATFTATATGTAPLSYQWYFNGTALTDGALVSGSTTTNLNISNVQTNDPGPYQLVVTNQYGSATSSIATLTVLIPPSVTMQPSNATVLFSSNIILAATATGTGPLSYQWYFSGAPMSDGGRFSGSRTGILNITNAQMGDVGSYQVVVTNAYGTATSAPASVVVVPLTGWGDDTYGELNFPTYLATVVAIATGSYQALYWNLGLRTDGTVGGWGARQGQTINDIPAGLDSVVAVSAGYRHGLALRSDGTVVAFGDNSFGETTVPPGLSNVVAIAAGGDYSLALQSDGTVIGWGYNFPFPSAPLPGFTNILAISAGTFDSLGLRYDGTVVGWGYNAYGEASSPAGLSNVIAVSAGAFHSLALKSDGTVAAWGYNYNGQATVPLGLSNVTAIAGGREHSVALRSDGTVVAWGDNSAGQATVPPGLSNVVAVTAGDFHSLALLQNPATQAPPSVWWLGLTNQIVPSGQTIALIPSVTGPLPISYQWYLDGSALSGQTNRWLVVAQSSGSGSYQLVARNSYGWTTSQVAAVHFQPFIVQQPTNQWLGFSSNVLFSASAIGEAPLSYQWYFNGSRLTDGGRISGSATTNLIIANAQTNDIGSYQLLVTNNYGSVASSVATLAEPTPAGITTQPANQVALLGSTAFFSITAVGADPLVYQWQKDGTNLVNDSRLSGATSPALAVSNVQSSDSGDYSVLVTNLFGAVTSTVASLSVVPVAAWGDSSYGQTNVPLTLTNTIAIAAGSYFSLALDDHGVVTGWGNDNYGQTDAPAGLTDVAAIAAGYDHSLAIKSDGTVIAWGDDNSGQTNVPPGLSAVAVAAGQLYSLALKSDSTVVGWGVDNLGQVNVPSGLSNVVAIAAGEYHCLALKNDGTVAGWGYNQYGDASPPPGGSNIVAISAGALHSLALKSDGTVIGWGFDRSGQIDVPAGLSDVVAIAAGWNHSLALKRDGTVVAWGDPTSGQTAVPAFLHNTVAIAANTAKSLALVENPAARVTPMIWWQGATNRALIAGQPAVFVPYVNGSLPFRFQWLFNGLSLNGETNKWLVLPSVQPQQAGSYQFTVANNYGAITSQVSVLTVITSPVITGQPTDQTVPSGSNVTFAVSATGVAPLSYAWYFNGIQLTNGGRIFGATNTTLTISNAQVADSGAYRAIVTNLYGAATSYVAMLTVYAPPQIVVHPSSAAVLVGSNASFTVVATGTALSYQWYFNGAQLSDTARISGSASPMLNISSVQASDVGGYTCLVTNFFSNATSRRASLTVLTTLTNSVRYVALDSTNPVAPYLDWITAATNIQDAVDAAVSGDWVVVSNGIYRVGARAVYATATNRVVIDKPVTVQSVNGPGLTSIEGSSNLAAANGNFRCVYVTNGAALLGFTLTNGSTGSGDVILAQSGAGVWCESASVVISNCFFINNSAGQYGGGAFRGALLNCVLSNNMAAFGGGACSNTLLGCTLVKNFARFQNLNSGGGAIYSTLTNCLLVANGCYGGGGGAFACNLTSCVLSNNTAISGGGVCLGTVRNCLISSNNASSNGGGAYSNSLINCVLKNNAAPRGIGGGAYSSILVNCTVVSNGCYSVGGGIWGGWATNSIIYFNNPGGNQVDARSFVFCCSFPSGSITNNPLFVNLAAGDLHLQSTSPCINSGNNAYLQATTDFDGNPRIVGGTVDLGAYEFQPLDRDAFNVWLQQYDLPTDGSATYADPDHDGLNNLQEWIVGTVPTNPASVLRILSVTPGPASVYIVWQSVSNRAYFLERSADLSAHPPFITLAAALSGQDGTTTYADTSATGPGPFFYRVGVQADSNHLYTPFSLLSYAWLQQYRLPTDGTVDFADTDGDGMNNWQEWIAGTNPTNAASFLGMKLPLVSASNAVVSWQSVSGKTYFLQRSTNLAAQPPFLTLQSNILGQSGTTSFIDTNIVNTGTSFYRVGVQQ